MSTFLVTVRQLGQAPIVEPQTGTDVAAVIMAAYDKYGAAGVSAKPI